MFEFFKDRTNQIIIVLLVVFSIISLWVRLLPMFNMGNTDILSMVASDDPLYNLRQVEQIMANYPNYAWYDPMTLFPTGSVIYWGPLFPTLIATIGSYCWGYYKTRSYCNWSYNSSDYGNVDDYCNVFHWKNCR